MSPMETATSVTLNDEESAAYDAGEEGKHAIETTLMEEMQARRITQAVQVQHVNGDGLFGIEATQPE